MNRSILQNLSKFEPKLAQFMKILEKKGWFCSKFGPKLILEWVAFSLKSGIYMGLLSNFVLAHPYKNQTKLEGICANGLIYIYFGACVSVKSVQIIRHLIARKPTFVPSVTFHTGLSSLSFTGGCISMLRLSPFSTSQHLGFSIQPSTIFPVFFT